MWPMLVAQYHPIARHWPFLFHQYSREFYFLIKNSVHNWFTSAGHQSMRYSQSMAYMYMRVVCTSQRRQSFPWNIEWVDFRYKYLIFYQYFLLDRSNANEFCNVLGSSVSAVFLFCFFVFSRFFIFCTSIDIIGHKSINGNGFHGANIFMIYCALKRCTFWDVASLALNFFCSLS